MDNKRTTILAFVAIAMMFAVCFVGFSMVSDDGADAETTYVASVTIGSTTTNYETIESAVTAAQPNDTGNDATITLLANTTTSGTLSFTKPGQYILDIGTYTLTQGNNNYMITLGGSSPPVYPIDTINTSAQLTIKGTGSIVAKDTAFRSYGTMIFGEKGVGPTVSIYNAKAEYSIFKVEEGSYLTVNGGTFNLSTNEGNAVKRVMQSFGITVINGGTFNADVELWSWTQGDKDYVSTIEINGGTFNGDLIRGTDNTAQTKLSDDDTFTIKGGSFTDLANAVKYAESEAKIALADDVTITKQIDIDKSMKIDLNGHTLTATKCHAFNINKDDLTFSIDGQKENSSIIADNYVVMVWYKSNTTVNITGGYYKSDNYAFVLYSEGGQFDMKGATVEATTSALWVGGKQATKVNIEDSTMTITGQVMSVDGDFPVAVELGTVKEATIKDVTIESTYVGIEIKSGKVTIDGQSTITSAYYNMTSQMGSGVNGGSITAVCINNAYYNVGGSTTPPNVTIGKDVSLLNTAENADHVMIITSGYKGSAGSYSVVDKAPIFVTSSLPVDEVGIVYSDSTTKAATSPVVYNGCAYVETQALYDAAKGLEGVKEYYITLAEGVKLSIGSVTGDVQLAGGAVLEITKDSAFTGTIFGPDDNKLVANGMKAGDDGITITGGSLIISGKIVQDSGTYSGVTVTVSGDSITIAGTLDEGATMVIEKDTSVTIAEKSEFASNGTITNNGTIVNEGTLTNNAKSSITNTGAIVNKSSITNNGTVTNTGTLKMVDESTIEGTIVNTGIVADERAEGSKAVTMDTSSTGVVVTKDNASAYEESGIKVIVETDKFTSGTVTSDTNEYAFVDAVTTTGDLNVVMNDGYKQYTIVIPKGTTIAATTIISVEYLDFTSDTTKYEITTPGITEFSVKVPVQTGFKSAKVYCDGSTAGVSNVKYSANSGYVTFDAGHNSTFTIVLSNATPSSSTSDVIDEDTAFVGAIVVLVVAILALAVVIKRR